jgi:galactosylceramide sulfotransferase/galactose-3-O-sulfotransferase 3
MRWAALVALAACEELRPFILCKTHKTGSSTFNTIMWRIAASKQWRVLIPDDYINLQYPENVPFAKGTSEHRYDAILNHAVFGRDRLGSYVKKNPFVASIVRDPVSRIRSAWTYYRSEMLAKGKQFPFEMEYRNADWTRMATAFRQCEGLNGCTCANGQAFDLGWFRSPEYKSAKKRVAFLQGNDQNKQWSLCNTASYQQWLDRMQAELDFVAVTEYFDESLVLLGRMYGLSLNQLPYIPKKVSYVATSTDHDQLTPTLALPATSDDHMSLPLPRGSALPLVLETNKCDHHLYKRFNDSFWEHWAREDAEGQLQGRPSLADEVRSLRRMNADLAEACDSEGTKDSQVCKVLQLDSKMFTKWYALAMNCTADEDCFKDARTVDINVELCKIVDCSGKLPAGLVQQNIQLEIDDD